MQAMKSISWVVGVSIVAGSLAATPARADRSYSDITGTNIWNNTAPGYKTDGRLDPNLVARINRINQESEAAFKACDAAISQAEQQTPSGPRRYARQPAEQNAEVPVACRQLEELRTEAEQLRSSLQQTETLRAAPGLRTW